MAAKYEYALREILQERKKLGEILENLGEQGWEVVSIVEITIPQHRAGWLIVSKRICTPSDKPPEMVPR